MLIVNSKGGNMRDRAVDGSGVGYGLFVLASFGRDG